MPRDCECQTHAGPHWLHMALHDRRRHAEMGARARELLEAGGRGDRAADQCGGRADGRLHPERLRAPSAVVRTVLVLARLVLWPFAAVALARRWLLRLLLTAGFVAFLVALAASVADAQTSGDLNPWDRPGDPLGRMTAATEASGDEDAGGDLCDSVTGILVRIGCRVANGGVGGVVDDTVGAATAATLEGLVGAVADGAVWLLSKIAGFLDASTSPDVTSRWFVGRYDVMVALSALVVLPLVLVAVVDAVVHARPGQVLRSLFVYLPLAGFLTVVAVELVDLSLVATDWASAYVSGNIAADTTAFLESVGTVLAGTSGSGLPLAALLLGALLTLFGGFVLLVELILRNAGINLAVLFTPTDRNGEQHDPANEDDRNSSLDVRLPLRFLVEPI